MPRKKKKGAATVAAMDLPAPAADLAESLSTTLSHTPAADIEPETAAGAQAKVSCLTSQQLEQLLREWKLQDALVFLREWGAGCMGDLHDLDCTDIEKLAISPLLKKRLNKLVLHITAAEPGDTLQVAGVCDAWLHLFSFVRVVGAVQICVGAVLFSRRRFSLQPLRVCAPSENCASVATYSAPWRTE